MEIISHRGLGFKKPENGYSALFSALSSGFSVEFDVRMTRDEIPVISHDADCRRLFDEDKKISELDFIDIEKFYYKNKKEKMNTFYSTCYLIKYFDKKYNAIHIKETEKEFIKKIIKMIEDFRIEEKSFIFSVDEESLDLIKNAKKINKKIRTALHIPENSELFKRKYIKMCDILWVDEKENWYSEDMVKIAHKMGKKIIAMSPELLKKEKISNILKRCNEIKKMGYDGLCTDHPLEVRTFIKEK